MKIDLNSIDREQFMVHDHVVNGEVLSLVQPQHIGAKWNRENKIFRSSVWNAQGELVSAGFPKFVNWGENPEVFPLPTSLKNCDCVEKVDGSLLIVSKYKGNYILRTRGTVDASTLKNGEELKIFKEKYLQKCSLFMGNDDTWISSLLFEWTSPIQRIVLNYGLEPRWILVGQIYHDEYVLATQAALDQIGRFIECLRPCFFSFTNAQELISIVDQWKDKEGVVVYSDAGQTLHKVKSAWYLALHHMKSELSSFDKVVDVWANLGRPLYTDFYTKIAEQFDFELANQIQGDISRICDGWKEVQKIEEGMKDFVKNSLEQLPSRKEQALKVLSSYGNTNRASFCFKLLDGKTLESDDYKKLLYQVLKK